MDEQNVPYDISTEEVGRGRDFNQRQLFKPLPAATRNENVVKVLRLLCDETQETKFVVYADTYESQGMILEHLRKAFPSWNVAMTPNGASDNESRFAVYDEFCSSGKQILIACRLILYGIFLDRCNTAVFRDPPQYPHLFVLAVGGRAV
ncbi:hypothetical protein DTO027B5_8117 [Paecilomyces variotii]|nr:hypothetical protein DTO169C6_8264 [Paecilomyces variotii]KAJ9329131.1 hypothetical protein DTO027B3_531 [Paecilomyces variotii]KAJ9330138.1 hypothetical protein DTO027B5_8117 [Paecilomyces variotii]